MTIGPSPGRIVVKVAGRVIADTRAALTLREASYPPVQYIPRQDVDMSLLQRTDTPHTALQGRLRLLQHPDRRTALGERGLARQAPYAAVTAIKDHLAFYPDRVDALEEQEAVWRLERRWRNCAGG